VIYNQKLQTILNVETTLYPADTVLHRIDYLPAGDKSVLAANPSVGYINQQIEVSRLEKKVERSRALPDLSIGYFSQTMQGTQEINGVPRVFGTGNRFTGIQAGIAVPLWFAPYSAKAKAAKLKEKIAQTDAESYSKSLSGSYHSLTLELSKNSNSVDYYEKQAIPEADLIIEQATRSYKGGAMDYLDYILSLNRALSIKQNYLDALNNYNQTIISIDFITGKIY
jgi:cobalt-zinc-cadmium resistance protein CzcA